MSRPVWARGLKLLYSDLVPSCTLVAPCVGAWIETTYRIKCYFCSVVAPCVGAWIETQSIGLSTMNALVAPCVGAWIET